MVRLRSRHVECAGEGELLDIPDEADLFGWIRFVRERNHAGPGHDRDIVDRLVIISFLEDLLAREKLHALLAGQRIKGLGIEMSRAMGMTSRQASGQERERLRAALAGSEQTAEGRARRGSRNGAELRAEERKVRGLRAWLSEYRPVLEKTARALVDATPAFAGHADLFWLEDLADTLVDADNMTGDWESVAGAVIRAVRHIGDPPGHLRQEAAAALEAAVEVALAIETAEA
ncbi:hypothetical protein GCM10022221_67110 [Actinocorallia aurea]